MKPPVQTGLRGKVLLVDPSTLHPSQWGECEVHCHAKNSAKKLSKMQQQEN